MTGLLRWQPWFSREGLASASDGSSAWTADDEATWVCRTDGSKTQDTWLRYHHIVPSPDDWESIKAGNRPADLNDRKGQLITDFYGYNAFTSIEQADLDRRTYNPGVDPESYANPVFGSRSLHPYGTYGLHWVGDLALDCNVTVRSEEGQLLLLLVKGGINFWCGIDVATGIASLSASGGLDGFTSDDGKTSVANPQGQTRVRGGGVYHVRFANVDSELRLWVNGTRVQFEGPTTYAAADRLRPVTTEADPGDLAPLGIGSRAASLEVHRLRVYRDIYYVATDGSKANEYRAPYSDAMILKILQTPSQWSKTPLFDQRGEFIQTMGPDQFFPMGDNSPQSSDARMWTGHNYFERELLIGRAVLIYWPHPWYRPIPYFPNFERMRLIH